MKIKFDGFYETTRPMEAQVNKICLRNRPLAWKVSRSRRQNAYTATEGNNYKTAAVADDDIPAYCIGRRVSKRNAVLEKYEDVVVPLPATKELKVAQPNNVISQNLKEVLKKNGKITVNKDGLLCRKVPIDGAVRIFVFEHYGGSLL